MFDVLFFIKYDHMFRKKKTVNKQSFNSLKS